MRLLSTVMIIVTRPRQGAYDSGDTRQVNATTPMGQTSEGQ